MATESSIEAPADTPCARKRGRPLAGTEAARRQVLLAAAEKLFFEQGFGASSLEAIAKAAGISKKTIYCFFDSKEELFEAVLKDHIERAPLPDFREDIPDAASLEQAMIRNLTEAARVRLVPFAVELFRLTIAEAPRFPEIAETFFREAPKKHVAMFAKWLQSQVDHGLLKLDNPEEAALFMSAVMITEPLRTAALGIGSLPSPAAIEAKARSLAKLFLTGCLAKPV
jgi:AcrR family transcriptional regulator